jgi:ribosomal protein S12 methylthiotransferase
MKPAQGAGTYYLDPFGCVKNQVDGETMMARLDGAGWIVSEDPGTADLIIVNSCGFIESAKKESINAVLSWRKHYPEKKILLAGCLAQRYAKELSLSLPEADLLFGNGDLSGITEAARAALGLQPAQNVRGVRTAAVPDAGRRPLLSLPGSAYVKISEGCDNRCSFCAVPLIRGGARSRGIGDILDECKTLLDRGIRELCLIGQDTGSWGRDLGPDAPGLPRVLEAVSRLEGRFWVRLLYIHPDHFPLPILDIMKGDSRFLPYFDIPFQHASPGILSAMNRRGNAEIYLGLAAGIREKIPGAVIRSTFMTGFPGETDGDFGALLDFQEKARLDWLGCFAYSREEDTAAYSMKGQVSKKIAGERKRVVEERQVAITEKQMERFIGGVFDVLVEEKIEAGENSAEKENRETESLYLGRLYCHAPEVDGAAVIRRKTPHSGGMIGGQGSAEGGGANDANDLKPGNFVRGRVFARAGFDLEVEVEC